MRYGLLGLPGVLVVLAAGCGSLGQRDGMPASPPDVSKIPDAVPRVEPRSAYGNPSSYVVDGRRYHTLATSRGYVARGIASWYGTKFQGRRTSSGEPYDMYAMTAAHRTLPLPSYVRVTNLENGRHVVVRVNDRGPFHPDRLIDLSYVAARKLGIVGSGTARVEVQAIGVPRPKPAPNEAGAAAGEAAVRSTSAAPATVVYLQVGAFHARANAERLDRRVRAAVDVMPHIARTVRAGETLYRVRLGPLAGGAEAKRLAALLTANGLPNARVVVESTSGQAAAPVIGFGASSLSQF